MSNQVKIFVRTYIIKKTQPLRLNALPLIYIKEVLDIMKKKDLLITFLIIIIILLIVSLMITLIKK